MRDIHSGQFISVAIAAAVLTADNTPIAVDLIGFEGAEIHLAIGAGGITFTSTNKIEFKLSHSDDNTTYAPVTDDDMLGVTGIASGIIKALIAAHADPAAYRFGYIGGKRYLKLLADFGGTHGTGTPISATVQKGLPSRQPQPDQA